jgi:hypothetical protein
VAAIDHYVTTERPMTDRRPSITVTVPPSEIAVRLLAMLMAPAMVIIMGVDLRLRGEEGLLFHAMVDWSAHILTALVIFAAIRALGFPVNWVMVCFGAIIADADYLLIREGYMHHLGDSSRGLLHTLVPALGLIAIGLVIPPLRVFLLSLGIAMLTHVLRDSATAQTAWLWPLDDQTFHLRYSFYLAILLGFTLVTTGIVALGARPLRE